MHADMSRRWIVFREQIGVSATEDVAISIDSSEAGILAAIRYQNGFWMLPSARHKLSVNGVAFQSPVPIFSGAALSVGGASLDVLKPELSLRPVSFSSLGWLRVSHDR